jgi:hypothetical protein
MTWAMALVRAPRSGLSEPDVEVTKADGGQLTVAIRGLDVHDLTTDLLRASSTDDIAAWFLDTDYDGDACSSATPTTPTTASAAPSGPTSARRPGRPSTRPSPGPSRSRGPARSPSRSDTDGGQEAWRCHHSTTP